MFPFITGIDLNEEFKNKRYRFTGEGDKKERTRTWKQTLSMLENKTLTDLCNSLHDFCNRHSSNLVYCNLHLEMALTQQVNLLINV